MVQVGALGRILGDAADLLAPRWVACASAVLPVELLLYPSASLDLELSEGLYQGLQCFLQGP